jgi:aerobic carbon-monoxide dehydrogenase medium subunit
VFPAAIEEYRRPKTLAEARAALDGYDPDDIVLLAGGQSVMQAIKARMVRPRCIIDLQDLAELKGVSRSGGLRIGALTRYVEIAEDASLSGPYAALRDAAQHVGDRQVRNRGTIGGSVCWNYVASCLPAVVLGLDATLDLLAADGTSRQVPIDDFLIGPLETARKSDEFLISLTLPQLGAGSGSAYRKWGLVTDALPVVGVCVLVTLAPNGTIAAARVTLSGLAAGAHRSPAAEAGLIGSDGGEAAIAVAFAAAADAADAQADKWADAAYRRQLIRSLGNEVAATAIQRARAGIQGVRP